MLRFSHRTLIILSGLIWMGIGCFLLQLGLNLLLKGPQTQQENPLLQFLTVYLGERESAAIFVIALCLYVGYLKGRYVLGKSVRRGVLRILALPNPSSLTYIYSPKYYLLIGLMVGLGISIKYLGLSNDWRGSVDVVIGSALINGALLYFRFASKPLEASKNSV